MEHETRFCTSPDGVGLAYAMEGGRTLRRRADGYRVRGQESERVRCLVLYGIYARGRWERGKAGSVRQIRARRRRPTVLALGDSLSALLAAPRM